MQVQDWNLMPPELPQDGENAQAGSRGSSLQVVLLELGPGRGVRGQSILEAQLSATHGLTWADLGHSREKGHEQRWGTYGEYTLRRESRCISLAQRAGLWRREACLGDFGGLTT